jgi:ferritin
MIFSERTQDGFNEQLGREIEAFYTYLAMSEYFDALGLNGFSTWFENQSAEEWMHAMKLRTYVQDRGGRVRYREIGAPESEFSSVLEVFERTFEREQSVSQSIADLYALVVEEKDFASQAFLNWFVTEQVEEEKVVRDIIDWLKRIGDSQEGLYLLDKQLGSGPPSGAGSVPAEV